MIFLTGSTGFLGKVVLKKLLDSNIPVRCSYRSYIPLDNKNVTYIKADLCSPTLTGDLFKGCSVIIHCAGLIKGERHELMQSNCFITKRVVENAISSNYVKKIIYLSSVDTLLLNNAYAQSKRLAEEAVINSGLGWVIIRPSLIFGMDDNKNITVLNKIVKKFHVLPLPFCGDFKWEPVFVGDLADYIIKIAQDEDVKNKEINVVGPESMSFKEIINILSSHNNVRPVIISLSSRFMNFLRSFFFVFLGEDKYNNIFSGFCDKIISENNNSEKVYLKTKLRDIYSSSA